MEGDLGGGGEGSIHRLELPPPHTLQICHCKYTKVVEGHGHFQKKCMESIRQATGLKVLFFTKVNVLKLAHRSL